MAPVRDARPQAYYVYYRVDPRHADAARRCVTALVARVQADSGTPGRWLRKHGEPLLWMEVYEPVHDAVAFEAALNSAVGASGLDACLQSGSVRKLERFEPWD